MRDGNWFRQGRGRSKGGKSRSGKAKRQRATRDRRGLSFETLEDRRMLAVFLVTNTLGDATVGSLRWAVNGANANAGADTILFAEYAFEDGTTNVINLEGGHLWLTESVSILGPGAQTLRVNQTTPGRNAVFTVHLDVTAQISGMTISGGTGLAFGGGVVNSGNLTMTETIVRNNSSENGGGIANLGNLTLDRSLVMDNTAQNGGGIYNQTLPSQGATIRNSTVTGNFVTGSLINGNQSYGGGVYNALGRVTITNSTITENESTGLGGGVASFGNPLPDEEGGTPPPSVIFTSVRNSIIYGNINGDVDRVGKSDDDPPVDLLASITSLGNNILETGNATDPANSVVPFDPLLNDQIGVDPKLLDLEDYGGGIPVFMPDFTDPLDLSPAIDAGSGFVSGYEARGRHFTRTFDFTSYAAAVAAGIPPEQFDPRLFRDPFTALVDIGAVEVQAGLFLVDTLFDEDDGSYSGVYTSVMEAGEANYDIGGYTSLGDFALREAILFSELNPLTDLIQFSPTLISKEVLDREDDTPSAPPTILLTLGQLFVVQTEFAAGAAPYTQDLVIKGPTDFVLEVDATGNDSGTPDLNDGLGSRVLQIDNFDPTTFANVYISNLTFMGADEIGRGGAILSRENVTLKHMTFKDNFVTDDGGAVAALAGTLVVEESTFKNNRGGDDGGAIFVETAVAGPQTGASVINSTLSANSAGDKGAGIYNKNSQLLVSFSTITLNDANSTRGSGIANEGANSNTTLWASIVSGNETNDIEFVTAPAGATLSTFGSLGHNLIGNGNARNAFNQTGDRINILDPRLAPLANTGGLIETHRPIFDHNPALSSPVIDMGPLLSGAPPLAPPTNDQRGGTFLREFGARADIGAYEVQRVELLVSTTQDENDGFMGVGELSLREAIALTNSIPTLPGSQPDKIGFDPSFFFGGEIISLGPDDLMVGTPGDLRITDSLIIEGPGADLLSISGAGLAPVLSFLPQFAYAGARMFTISDNSAGQFIDVQITGMTFRDAHSPVAGGAIFSSENLTLDDVAFINNSTVDPDETTILLPPVDSQGLHGAAIHHQQGTLKISNALFTGNMTTDALADGGAIHVAEGALVTEFVTLSGNQIFYSGNGGAIALKNATYSSYGDTISSNSTQGGVGDGGGIYSDASTVELRESTVSGNFTIGANAEGGGIFARNSNLALIDSVVGTNTTAGSQSHGAGIFLSGGTTTLTRSIVSQNVVNGQQSVGGGIAMVGGAVTLKESTVDRNRAANLGGNGGGIWNGGGTLVVDSSSLWNNQAVHSQSSGGGVYSDDMGLPGASDAHSTLIVNSTVSGNSAGFRGGGVLNADGVMDIRHSTITNNSTPFMNAGNGVASHGTSATTTRLYSSIVAGNVGSATGTGSDVDFVEGVAFNSIQSLGYNLIGTGNSLAKFTAALNDQKNALNPGLGALTNNGGVTRTHALLAGSAAIDQGNPADVVGASNVPALDQRGLGFTRVYNGDNAGTARIDVGAFELQGSGLAGDFSGDDIVDGTDFLTWQRNVAKTNPTAANGDLNNDNVVDAADLAGWGASFGAGAENAAAVAAVSIGSVASSEAYAESSAMASTDLGDGFEQAPPVLAALIISPEEVDAAPSQAAERVAASFVGLGRPGARAADGALAGFSKRTDRQVAAAIAVLSREQPAWFDADDDDSVELSLLDGDPTSEDAERAEDAVFAAWDAEFTV